MLIYLRYKAIRLFRVLIIFIIIASFSLDTVKAQSYNITGTVVDTLYHPITGVLLVMSKSTSKQSECKVLSDSTGAFKLILQDTGFYKLVIIANGFQKESIDIHVLGDINLNKVLLKSNFQSIGNITVYSKKPIVERRKDRFIFNAPPDLLALTTNGYELLGLTPLVTTSQNGSIALSGVENVIVQVNGRRVNLTGQALQSYLQNIPSKSIARIELITTPSSKNDAEGNGGIINIVLVQSHLDGIVGNIALSIKQASYLTRYGSYSMNINKKKLSVLLGVAPSGQRLRISQLSDVSFPSLSMGTPYRVKNTIQKKLLPSNAIGSNLGIEYKPSNRVTLGVAAEYSNSKLTRLIETSTFYQPSDVNVLDSIYNTINSNREKSRILTITGYYKLNIDSSSTLNLEASSFFYKNRAIATTKSIKEPLVLLSSNFINSLQQQIENKSIQIDYTKNYKTKYSAEIGLKYNSTNTGNKIDFSNWNGTVFLPDPLKSSDFDYREIILAGYVNLSHTLSKRFNYQIGTRIESTTMKSSDNSTNRVYTRLFPTVYLNYLLPKNLSISYAVAGRIGRPSFIDLNPFRYYLTDKIFILGNPLLKPTTNVKHELSIAKGGLVMQLVYNSNRGIISTESLLDTSNKTFYYTKGNFSNLKTFSLNLSLFKTLAPWIRFNLSSALGAKYFNGYFNNLRIATRSTYGNVSLFTNITLSKKHNLYSSFYISGTLPYVSNLSRVKGQGNLSFGLRRVTSKISYGFSFQDPFKWTTDRFTSYYDVGNVYERSYYDARGVGVFVNLPFGKQSVAKLKKKDAVSSLDEKNRL